MADRWNPTRLILHDYGGEPKNADGMFNPYHALVFPDGSIRYRYPDAPYGKPAPHAFHANPESIGLSYAGQVGSQPTEAALRRLKQEHDAIRKQFPSITKIQGHGEAFAETRNGPNRASRDGRDLIEASWRARLSNPSLDGVPTPEVRYPSEAPRMGEPVTLTSGVSQSPFMAANKPEIRQGSVKTATVVGGQKMPPSVLQFTPYGNREPAAAPAEPSRIDMFGKSMANIGAPAPEIQPGSIQAPQLDYPSEAPFVPTPAPDGGTAVASAAPAPSPSTAAPAEPTPTKVPGIGGGKFDSPFKALASAGQNALKGQQDNAPKAPGLMSSPEKAQAEMRAKWAALKDNPLFKGSPFIGVM